MSMRLNKKKMLHKRRSFKALLIGYDENMKYEGNNSKVTTVYASVIFMFTLFMQK